MQADYEAKIQQLEVTVDSLTSEKVGGGWAPGAPPPCLLTVVVIGACSFEKNALLRKIELNQKATLDDRVLVEVYRLHLDLPVSIVTLLTLLHVACLFERKILHCPMVTATSRPTF
jgi:hypothetical protein